MDTPVDIPVDIREKWDSIYTKSDASRLPEPCYVLNTYSYLLPESGNALDIACGLGGNALFLAERGFKTTALDISSVAIARIQGYQHPLIDTLCESVDSAHLNPASFDVIVVSNYLDRTISDLISETLAPGGILFYQTFVQDKVDQEIGPKNPDYLLAANELLRMFGKLNVRVFSDQGCQGDSEYGFRNQSYLVAQRSQ